MSYFIYFIFWQGTSIFTCRKSFMNFRANEVITMVFSTGGLPDNAIFDGIQGDSLIFYNIIYIC